METNAAGKDWGEADDRKADEGFSLGKRVFVKTIYGDKFF